MGLREAGQDLVCRSGGCRQGCREGPSQQGARASRSGRKEAEWQGALPEVTNAYLLQLTKSPGSRDCVGSFGDCRELRGQALYLV